VRLQQLCRRQVSGPLWSDILQVLHSRYVLLKLGSFCSNRQMSIRLLLLRRFCILQIMSRGHFSGPLRPVRLQALHSRYVLLKLGSFCSNRQMSIRLLLLRRFCILQIMSRGHFSGPLRPVRLQALHIRQLLLSTRPLRS
jgi:hypothetical protein